MYKPKHKHKSPAVTLTQTVRVVVDFCSISVITRTKCSNSFSISRNLPPKNKTKKLCSSSAMATLSLGNKYPLEATVVPSILEVVSLNVAKLHFSSSISIYNITVMSCWMLKSSQKYIKHSVKDVFFLYVFVQKE